MASVKMDKYEDVAKQVALEEDDDFEEFETKGKFWSATHTHKKKKHRTMPAHRLHSSRSRSRAGTRVAGPPRPVWSSRDNQS